MEAVLHQTCGLHTVLPMTFVFQFVSVAMRRLYSQLEELLQHLVENGSLHVGPEHVDILVSYFFPFQLSVAKLFN